MTYKTAAFSKSSKGRVLIANSRAKGLAFRREVRELTATLNAGCGTGSGGFQPGNTCARQGSQAGLSATQVAIKVAAVYKADHNPKDGGECGSVAYTLQHLNPRFKAFAITTKDPYDETGEGRGISHLMVSEDGKTFYDGKGKPMTAKAALKNYDSKDLPKIVPAAYSKDKSMRHGGYYKAEGSAEEFDAGMWQDFYDQLTTNAFCPTGPGGGVDPTCSPKGKADRGPLKRREGLTYEDPDPPDNLGRSYLSNARLGGMHDKCQEIVLEELDRLVETYGVIPGGLELTSMNGGHAVGSCSKGKIRHVSTEEAEQLWASGENVLNMKVGPQSWNMAKYYHDDKTGATIHFKVDGPRGGSTGWFGDKPAQFGIKYQAGGTVGMRTGRGEIRDVVVHEFGHALAVRSGDHKAQKLPANKEVAKIIKSGYAYENLAETIAEAFVYYDAGGRDPVVVKFLNETIFKKGVANAEGTRNQTLCLGGKGQRAAEGGEGPGWGRRQGVDGPGREATNVYNAKPKPKSPNPLRLDPSRTGRIRAAWERDMNGRFDRLKKAVYRLVVEEDAFGLKGAGLTNERKYSTTQAQVVDPAVVERLDAIKARLSPDDVTKMDTDPHVTVRYGLHDKTPDRVRQIARQYGPLRARLGSLTLFNTPDADVLKVDVVSQDLSRLHRELGILPNTETHPDYHPHLTVAYLKPGTGNKYVGPSWLEGTELVFKGIVFSNLTKQKTDLTRNAWCPTSNCSPTVNRLIQILNGQAGSVVPKSGSQPGQGTYTEHRSGASLATNAGRWAFLTMPKRLEEFVKWFKVQALATILGTAHPDNLPTDAEPGESWLARYVRDAYRNGLSRAYDDVTRPTGIVRLGTEAGKAYQAGGKLEFMRQAFGGPPSMERMKLIASRTFDDLNGITTDLSNKISQQLVEGMVQGKSPLDVGRKLNKMVDGYKNRGKAIAQTETLRAHNQGALQGMRALGVDKVGAQVEWATSGLGTTKKGNPSPCHLCAELQGVVLTLDEAEGLLPRHPYCRCAWTPANVGESTKGQLRTKSKIQQAVEDSIRAEMPKRKKRSLAEQKKLSSWAGADLKVKAKRPKAFTLKGK